MCVTWDGVVGIGLKFRLRRHDPLYSVVCYHGNDALRIRFKSIGNSCRKQYLLMDLSLCTCLVILHSVYMFLCKLYTYVQRLFCGRKKPPRAASVCYQHAIETDRPTDGRCV